MVKTLTHEAAGGHESARGVLSAVGSGYTDVAGDALDPYLKRVDLSQNALSGLGFLGGSGVRILNVSQNKLRSLEGVAAAADLTVLDVSDNPLQSLEGVEAATGLSALIAARCSNIGTVASMEAVAKLPSLHTLVLREVPLTPAALRPVMRMKNLRKLVLSSCGLDSLPWGGKPHQMSQLLELRLHGNKIPALNIYLAGCKELKILDLGDNLLDLDCLKQIGSLGHLTHLTLKGNPLQSGISDEAYRKAAVETCRGKLKYLDNQFASEELREKKEKKRGLAAAKREESSSRKQARLAIEADMEAQRERDAKGPVLRANTVLVEGCRPASKSDIEADLSRADENLFEMKKMQNGSTTNESASGLARRGRGGEMSWEGGAESAAEPAYSSTKADSALAFLLGQ